MRTEDSGNATVVKLPFFAVSTFKLAVMTVFSFGLYEVYWFYKNWQAVRDREFSSVNVTLRAVFSLFFCYQLFAKVRNYGSSINATTSIHAGLLATGWIMTGVLGLLPDPLSLLTLFSFLFLLPVQSLINEINRASVPDHDPNGEIRGWNWLWIVIGSVLILATIADALLRRH